MTKEQLKERGYEFKGRIKGRLLWTNGRDGEAVLVDLDGNEYYTESSSSRLFDFMDNRTKTVSFEIMIVPNYGPMAYDAKQEILG